MRPPFVFIIALALLFAGCASSKQQVKKGPPPADSIALPAGLPPVKAPGGDAVIKTIIERNRDIEDDFGWIEDSYNKFMIKNLSELKAQDYGKYARYLDNGAVYIIVHPAYTTFFNLPKKISKNQNTETTAHNAVEKLLFTSPDDQRMSLIQAQERQIRDFLEFKSTEEKLIVVIIEKNYEKSRSFLYKNKQDELKRFINEATNESASVLYMESNSGGGSLSNDNSVRLQEFILSTGATKILLGGSYLGRCVEGFYDSFVKDFGSLGVYLIPELTAVSPADINAEKAAYFLRPDSGLNVEFIAEGIKRNLFGNLRTVPNILHLSN